MPTERATTRAAGSARNGPSDHEQDIPPHLEPSSQRLGRRLRADARQWQEILRPHPRRRRRRGPRARHQSAARRRRSGTGGLADRRHGRRRPGRHRRQRHAHGHHPGQPESHHQLAGFRHRQPGAGQLRPAQCLGRRPQPRQRPDRDAHRRSAHRQRPGFPDQSQRRPVRQRCAGQRRRFCRLDAQYPRRRFSRRQLHFHRHRWRHREPGRDLRRVGRLPRLHRPEDHQRRHAQRAAGHRRHGRRRARHAQFRRRPPGRPQRHCRNARHPDREPPGHPRRGRRHPAHRRRRRSGHARRHQQQRRFGSRQPDRGRRAHRAHGRQRHQSRRRLVGCGRRPKRRRNHRPGQGRHAAGRRQPLGARRERYWRQRPAPRPPGRPRQCGAGRCLGRNGWRDGSDWRGLPRRQCGGAERMAHLRLAGGDNQSRRPAAGRWRQGHRLGGRRDALLRQDQRDRRNAGRQRWLRRSFGQRVSRLQRRGRHGCPERQRRNAVA